MENVLAHVATAVKSFLTNEVPDILANSAEALRKAPIPTTWTEATNLPQAKWLRLIPILTACLFCVITPFILLASSSSSPSNSSRSTSYWLTRALLLRWQGLMYLSAFATSAFQGRGLIGEWGLAPASWPARRPTPAFDFLARVTGLKGDLALELLSWFGVFLSLRMLTTTITSCFLPLLLWLMYLSIVNLDGSIVINYGWEWETLEVGFLSIFLCPLLTWSPFPRRVNPPRLVLWLYRWLAFRLLIGAGMSKLGRNSSDCWEELTCTTTHYVTQPMPNAMAFFFDKLPLSVHKLEVALTFVEQLVLPFLILVPAIRSVRIFTALAEIFLQLCIVGTGNYAWINYLGVVGCLAMLDDGVLHWLSERVLLRIPGFHVLAPVMPFAFSHAQLLQAEQARLSATTITPGDQSTSKLAPSTDAQPSSSSGAEQPSETPPPESLVDRGLHALSRIFWRVHAAFRFAVYAGLVLFIAKKSTDPLKELFTAAPWLHYYDDYFFVSSQGVFGFINQQRTALVLEYTHSALTLEPGQRECKDDESRLGFTDNQGNPLRCMQLADMGACQHPRYGAPVRASCARSCGECAVRYRSEGASWKELQFKNLPGALDRRPYTNSPYHYRLDWEVWIQTTARMDFAEGTQRVPGIVRKLIAKVLAGDTDAVELLGTPRAELLLADANGNERPPTGIRASWWRYTFASWEELRDKGQWWRREAIPRAGQRRIWQRDQDAYSADGFIPRRSSWWRQWGLLGTMVLAHTSVTRLLQSLCEGEVSRMRGALQWVVCTGVSVLAFAWVLLIDYPDSRWWGYFSGRASSYPDEL